MSNEDNQEKKANGNEEISKQLHDARIAKGYTIDDLQKKTKIQKRYLIAIEEGDFNSLPGDFYVRAFVKQYADAVGIDGIELLKNYDSDLPDTQNPEYVNKVSEDKIASRSAQRKVDDRYQTIRRYIPIAGLSLIVLIVIVVIWVAAARNRQSASQTDISKSSVSVSSNKEESKKNSEAQSSSKAASESAKAKKSSSSKKTNSDSKTKITKDSSDANGTTYQVSDKAKGSSVTIASSARAWVSLSENGSVVWQGALDAKGSHKVNLGASTTNVAIQMGNATANTIKVNGQSVPFDKSTQVQTVNLTFK